jgi:hypothetical protein
MSSEEQKKVPYISYDWNDVLEWERQAKEQEKLAEEKQEKLVKANKERETKEEAAKDLEEALNNNLEIEDEIEVKQEIIFDQNL